MKFFPYPLTPEVLDELVHPDELSELRHPVRRGSQVFTGNGYFATRIDRGAWIHEEIQPISDRAARRLDRLAWDALDSALERGDGWRDLALSMGTIRRRGIINPWREDLLAPTPTWRLAHGYIHLSMLQLIARLPRAAFYLRHTSAGSPLFFKFSGGAGIVAPIRRPMPAGFHFFKPQFDPLSGDELDLGTLKPRTVARDKNPTPRSWPPPEPID